MIFECSDYRAYLKRLLVDRIKKNSSYSLRAFSSQIGISPSMLSNVLNGEKNLSEGKASAIAHKLALSADAERYFVSLVQLENTHDVDARLKIISRLKELSTQVEVRDLISDEFHSTADWVCASGLALLAGYPKGLSAETIAERLGLTKFEVSEAMNRWVRLDLLHLNAAGKYVRVNHEHLMMKSKAPNRAIRKFHQSMLEKAIDSLETQSANEKYVGSETFVVDVNKLPEIAQVMEEAAAKILKIAKNSKVKNEVYHFGFQCFRITKKEVKR